MKIFYMFVVLYINKGGIMLAKKVAGYFFARTLKYNGSEPPCDVLMDSLPLWCIATGKAEPFFYFSPYIIFLKMLYTEKNQNLSILKERWAVAELEVSYKPKQKTGVIIKNTYDAYQVFYNMWDHSLINLQEQFACLFLNGALEVLGYRLINTGNVESTSVDLNLITTCALLCRARVVVFAHNHPSGNLKPSEEDKIVTLKAKDNLKYFDVRLIDHLIISDVNYYSFSDNSIIFEN